MSKKSKKNLDTISISWFVHCDMTCLLSISLRTSLAAWATFRCKILYLRVKKFNPWLWPIWNKGRGIFSKFKFSILEDFFLSNLDIHYFSWKYSIIHYSLFEGIAIVGTLMQFYDSRPPVLWSKWPLASSLIQAIKTCRQACPPGYLMHFS